jgi:hypothetical protein
MNDTVEIYKTKCDVGVVQPADSEPQSTVQSVYEDAVSIYMALADEKAKRGIS